MTLIKTGMEVRVLDASKIARSRHDLKLETGEVYRVSEGRIDDYSGITLTVGPSSFYVVREDLEHVEQVWKSPVDGKYYPIEPKPEVKFEGKVKGSTLIDPPKVTSPYTTELTKDFSPTKPEHYHHGGIDVFTYGEANFPKAEVLGYHRMSALKYISRYDRKGGLVDLEKAEVHLSELHRLVSGVDDK